MYNLSAAVFVRNTFEGAFCLFESMHQLMPLVDEFLIMDLGSDDGTREVLQEIEQANAKVRLIYGRFYKQDAGVFADLANEVISHCQYPHVLYYQADEIWHEDLVELTRQALEAGKRNLAFWRVQLKYNFQRIKWFPHPVHRIGAKEDFVFTNDGMNTAKVFNADMVSELGYIIKAPIIGERKFKLSQATQAEAELKKIRAEYPDTEMSSGKLWDMGMFTQWGDRYKRFPAAMPLNNMILDVSLTGAFLGNIKERRRMHLPFWGEGDVMPADEDGLSVDQWFQRQQSNQDWHKTSSPFDIPKIMEYHLGRYHYALRPELKRALMEDKSLWNYIR